jgi:hypothetical protein
MVMIAWLLDLQLPVQSVPITTNIVSLYPAQVQHYVIKFVSDLRQVGGFPVSLNLAQARCTPYNIM